MKPPPSVKVDDALRELIPRFMAHRHAELARLTEAVASHDLDEARRIGHSLKGVGGGYGFEEITRLGADIERAARDCDEAALAALTAELTRYLDSVEVRFD
jgi:HPt (histidine-containing phosphotransfer) domain-containing protein